MATVSITLGPVTVSKTITAGQTARVIDALKFLHGQGTNTEVLTAECNAIIASLLSKVRALEDRIAHDAVVPSAPIDLT